MTTQITFLTEDAAEVQEALAVEFPAFDGHTGTYGVTEYDAMGAYNWDNLLEAKTLGEARREAITTLVNTTQVLKINVADPFSVEFTFRDGFVKVIDASMIIARNYNIW